MFKTTLLFKSALLTIVVPALAFGCVRDVQTESAAGFSLASGQTWDWVPDTVETWQEYKRGAREARINVSDAYAEDAYAEQRQKTREELAARPEKPVSKERHAARREEKYDTEAVPPVTDPDAANYARALKREHKHIQESIAGELSSKGIQPAGGVSPTYYVAYYLFAGGEPVASRDYAAYEERTEKWEDRDDDTLVIDVVDPASGQLLWSGSGEGNARYGSDDSDRMRDSGRMRGAKEAVRHIMRDLK
jgi:hypothetical protein